MEKLKCFLFIILANCVTKNFALLREYIERS